MLRGKKIYLRAPELEDSRILSVWLNDRESNRYLDIIYPLSKRYADSFLMEFDENPNKKMFFIDNEDRKPIGIVIITDIKWEYRNCEIGIAIYDKAFRKKGYGEDALNTAVNFIFNEMNMHLVYLKTVEENKDAVSLYSKAGFEMEGLLRDRYFKNGEYENIIVMSKIKEQVIYENRNTK